MSEGGLEAILVEPTQTFTIFDRDSFLFALHSTEE